MLLIFYALEPEVRPFRRRLQGLRRLEANGCVGWQGRLRDLDLTLVATGVGMERAATSARRAFELFAPVQMVVSTGVAGALREELRAGTIVVADRLLSESTSGGAQASLEPPADRREDFVRALTVVGLSVVVGPTLTVPTALADAASKRRAHLESGAIAVDMESAVIAHEARRSGLDCMYLRSVLDAVDDRLPPVRLIDENGNVRPLTATGFFLSHPAMLFKWTPRVVRNMKIATANLAQALESLALSQA